MHFQLSVISYQLSVISDQLSVIREISTKTPKPQLSVFLVFTFSFKTVSCLINIFSVIVHRLTYREFC
ncbi:MAG: hypothetical protein EWV53_03590 [Microcystis panniformis Mp_MB_F_20051200_S9]|uniref:Uncharacterized protein n=1 Tax=Microcystis panniformis Mp_MB_F_20051200_S9 TaxID=2486223 RepID=A0A552Q8N2_9CHRO|nr:MAG: hypothetical protein EWV43_21220 [Microcystis panniformis Mp_MB_F_20080800_S26D]TRV45968.1 MAG: hypothetical protein EWV42_18915 [Microcystis panniformis Mp_GB_SS_20050300_S99D]TRV46719.1 MAG: hypothetical protein EWV87_15425 [Microcystis panniformis Mp_GB_SS_20050300_S99]TRV58570.1 MAG: hypothetical protein EWV69_13630 [Microcystis panniformis Mp_MB_F_20080800_S26]TRV63878.1 MAG: hypothetical protein EWV86_11495 [Microcystis panniformis Mp_MB_F_20051200_S9D]TRV65570.1 MAG: hypothetica